MKKIAVYVANVRSGNPPTFQKCPHADAKAAAEDICCRGTVTYYRKCKLVTGSGGSEVYWAVPAHERNHERHRARFDFVQERGELWKNHDQERPERRPCRPVVQLRGFIRVRLDGGETHNIALARNLRPHADARIDSEGNPWHPRWGVLHCLWQFEPYVRGSPNCAGFVRLFELILIVAYDC